MLDYALYLGHSDDFVHDGQPDVMCWTQGDYLLLETQDVTAVLNRVQDAFSFKPVYESGGAVGQRLP
ncbi:MAG: hypothetical protein LUF80_05295 [Oscillospiraceae bacterium]|nr:hypothetical protein [Oscillospiraceae bacterium]